MKIRTKVLASCFRRSATNYFELLRVLSVLKKYDAITEIKALKLPKVKIERNIERGGAKVYGKGQNQKKTQFSRTENFCKSLIWKQWMTFSEKIFALTEDIQLQEICNFTNFKRFYE